MNASGDSSSGSTPGNGSASSAIAGFLKLGCFGVIGFSSSHLLVCWILSWIIGQEFSTIVYVTAAATVVGALVTFTFAFLIALNLVLTAVTGFSQMGQMFAAAGAAAAGPQPANDTRPSRISEIGPDAPNNPDPEWFTMND